MKLKSMYWETVILISYDKDFKDKDLQIRTLNRPSTWSLIL